jgi:tetratricopeptide (TPR) repeat protein
VRKTTFFIAILCLAAAPAGDALRLVREGNAAFAKGDLALAVRQYEAAAMATDDPGLIAFNRAAIHFAEDRFRDAELDYLRCLADRDCPADRRMQAEFNRGVCLVKRGWSAKIYRTAITCFDTVLAMQPADAALLADARHNLEVAKLLWQTARLREQKEPPANDRQPDEDRQPDPPRLPPPTMNDPSEGGPGKAGAASPVPNGSAAGTPNPTEQKLPGAGTLGPLPDDDRPTPRSPQDTRLYLDRAALRLDAERRANAELLAGPDRKGVRDW